jgi:hypothetical protein
MTVLCSAIAKSGSRCRRPALAGKQHCLMHDPESAELRREAGRKGGRNRSAKARAAKLIPDAMTAEDLAGWLSLAFTNVLSGRIEPKVATAAAAIAGRLLEAQTAAAQPSIADLEEQVAVLRAMVERGSGGRVA